MAPLTAAGVEIVADTCAYLTPIMGAVDGPVMTDSVSGPGTPPANIRADVVIGGH